MNIDKKRLLWLLYSLLACLFVSLLIPVNYLKWTLATVLVIYSVLVCYFIKKRNILSIHKNEVFLILTVTSFLCLICYYLTGLRFGFNRNLYGISFSTFIRYILPISLIIISSEIIRYVFLAQNKKHYEFMVYICFILIEFLLVYNVSSFNSLNQIMDIIGLTLFPAVTYNLLYNNISKNYGFLPNIIFRLVITLYVYVVSVVPAIPDSLYGFSKLIIPILILGFINVLYKKKTNIVSVKKAKISNVFFVTTLFIITLLIMLVSNQFKFGTIVIATPSMSGEINTGDVIIYEKIDYDEIITVGQIIVFEKNKTLIVHRVVEIEYIDGTLRYYTKGDANEDIDSGYITKSDIIGITNVKVSYVGYPTLWLTSLFERD